jgi:hypothetical protein
MHRPLITCILGLLACQACVPEPRGAIPDPIDVSGDDCTASTLVYDKLPSEFTGADPGVAFINDGCSGDRIFLGFDGSRRELTRAEDLSLGLGGEYSDGELRALVKRGRNTFRDGPCSPGDDSCDPEDPSYVAVYEARVHVWSGRRSWVVDGTLVESGPY